MHAGDGPLPGRGRSPPAAAGARLRTRFRGRTMSDRPAVVLLSGGLASAEVLGSSDIFLGVNALDYSGYPDCRPEYIEAYQKMANLATKAGVEGRQRLTIHTPLIRLTKAEIIRTGLTLGVDYGLTSS